MAQQQPTAKSETFCRLAGRNLHDDERADRGEVILHEAASHLGVSKMTVVRLIKDGVLPAKQACVGAPYVIRKADLELPAVKRAIKSGRAVSHDPWQGTLEYQ